jgi:hypothetical protein
VPKLSLGEAPQYVKSDSRELEEWNASVESITNIAKRAYAKQCERAVQGAAEALAKYTGELENQISTLLKTLLQPDLPGADLGHNAAARFVLRTPTEADPDGMVKYIHDDCKGAPDDTGLIGEFLRDRSTHKVYWCYKVPLHRDALEGSVGHGAPALMDTKHVLWYEALDLERYIEWNTKYLCSEMASSIESNHFATQLAQQAKTKIDGLLESSGFKSKPPEPTVPLEESMALKVAECLVAGDGDSENKAGKKGGGKAKGKPKKAGDGETGGGSTGKKAPKAKAAKKAEAAEAAQPDEASSSDSDAPAGAGSGRAAPKGRAPRKSAGEQRERHRSASRSTAKSGHRSKSPHPSRRSTRNKPKGAVDKETGEGDSTSAEKGGGSGRGKGRSAKPKGLGEHA